MFDEKNIPLPYALLQVITFQAPAKRILAIKYIQFEVPAASMYFKLPAVWGSVRISICLIIVLKEIDLSHQ